MEKKNMPISYARFLILLTECLKKRCDKGCCFQQYEKLATNGVVKRFLTIKNGGVDVLPCIWMDEFYSAYVNNKMSLSDIAEEIFQSYKQNGMDCPINASRFMDWNKIRQGIRCRLINIEKNKILLSGVPHRDILDMSIVYYYWVTITDSVEGIINISNQHMKFWNADEKILYSEAWQNMHEAGEADVRNIIDRISSTLDMPQTKDINRLNGQMYVLSTTNRLYGAVYMTDLEKMAEIAERMDCDLWILPSSIHEVILIPCSYTDDAKKLADMVCEINKTELSAEEFLSSHVYYFNRKTARISIAA